MRDFHWVEFEELDHLCGAFEGWTLDDRQHIARVHMTEQFARLLKKQEHLIEVNEKIGYRPGWKTPTPTATQQQRLFEATQDLFQTYYAALAAMVAFLNRLPKFTAKYGHPSHNSTAKAIIWMRSLAELPFLAHMPFLEENADCLEEARAFRAVLDHPGGTQPYDWSTTKVGHHDDLMLTLFGDGKAPVGATAGPTLIGQGEWHFTAPFFGNVVSALFNMFSLLMAMTGRLYRPRERGQAFVSDPIWGWSERPMPTLPTGVDDPRLTQPDNPGHAASLIARVTLHEPVPIAPDMSNPPRFAQRQKAGESNGTAGTHSESFSSHRHTSQR